MIGAFIIGVAVGAAVVGFRSMRPSAYPVGQDVVPALVGYAVAPHEELPFKSEQGIMDQDPVWLVHDVDMMRIACELRRAQDMLLWLGQPDNCADMAIKLRMERAGKKEEAS